MWWVVFLDNRNGSMILIRARIIWDGGITPILTIHQPTTQNRPSCRQYKQPYPPRQQPGQTSNSGMSLEDIVKSLATNTLQFQQETKQFQQEARASIQSLDIQMGQMATTISQLEVQSSGKLPSQTVVNPRENASPIVLRNGKEVEILVKVALASSKQEKEKNVVAYRNVSNDDDVPKREFPSLSDYKPILPLSRPHSAPSRMVP